MDLTDKVQTVSKVESIKHKEPLKKEEKAGRDIHKKDKIESRIS